MSAETMDKNMPQSESNSFSYLAKKSAVCVLIGHSIEAVTSAVVLASLGQQVHLYADQEILAQQLHQYGFEHHLQALWQMYTQQQYIMSFALPNTADKLIQLYEVANDNDERKSVILYWLFLDSIDSVWVEDDWLTAFNHSQQQTQPLMMSGKVC